MNKKIIGLMLALYSFANAGFWGGSMMGSDGTFFDDDSFAKNHESMWIEGLSKRVFLGYMFSGFGMFRVPVALEWSLDYFTQSVGSWKALGTISSVREASYELNRQWTAVIRPGIHLGDGFVYALASVDNTEVSDTLSEDAEHKSQSVSLFPYSHLGLGLAFAIAPQTELMAEVRFSQKISKQLYSYVRGEEVALPSASTDVTIYNTQLMIGISYEL